MSVCVCAYVRTSQVCKERMCVCVYARARASMGVHVAGVYIGEHVISMSTSSSFIAQG